MSWHLVLAPPPRHRAGRVAGLALTTVLSGCSPSAVATLQDQAPVEVAEPATGAAARAVRAADEQADELDGDLGVAVLDHATGELAVGRGGDVPMRSASLSKVIVAVELFDRGRVTEQDRLLLRRALGPSDDEAMNALWERHDGPALISSAAGRMGLQQTRPPDDRGRWGDTITSARDVTTVFGHLLDQPGAGRDFVLDALHDAPQRAADGVDQRFGLMAMNGHAVKSGWMCCQEDAVWVHSAGVVDPDGERYVVALLSAQPSEVGYGEAVGDITETARTAVTPLR